MKCTQCNSEHVSLHGVRWSSEFGYIIEEGELLCDECAELRPGFEYSGDLLRKREKQLNQDNAHNSRTNME